MAAKLSIFFQKNTNDCELNTKVYHICFSIKEHNDAAKLKIGTDSSSINFISFARAYTHLHIPFGHKLCFPLFQQRKNR